MESLKYDNQTLLKDWGSTDKQKILIRKITAYQWTIFTIFLAISDIATILFAFRVAYIIRFNLSISIFQLDVNPEISFYRSLMLIILPVWIILFAIQGLYNRNNLLGGTKEYSLLLNSSSIGIFLIIAVGFLVPDFIFARGWLVASWAGAFLFPAFSRFIIRRGIYILRHFGFFLNTAVIVGANDEGILLAQQLMQWKSSGFNLLGFIDKKLPKGTKIVKHIHCRGDVEHLDEIISKHNVEEIILAASAFSSRDNMLEIFRRHGTADYVNVRFSSGIYEIMTTGLTVKEFAYVPLVQVNPVRLTGMDSVLKAILDYGLTIPGLILISPLLLLLAIIVKIDSPGPIFHKRRVVGVNNKEFDAYKFRTMHVNGDGILAEYPDLLKELAVNHKLKDDPRITRIGKIIRRLSLDELPQLFNVIKGDMSLVGPRMITPEEIVKYRQWDTNLLTVRPGITGLWQVSGRSDISYEERVRLDMHYIRNWSIWLDLQLLLQTIPAVMKSRGAY